MDSVENVCNWDFVGAFTRHGRELLGERWKNAGLTGNADARFLVIGEELSLPCSRRVWMPYGMTASGS